MSAAQPVDSEEQDCACAPAASIRLAPTVATPIVTRFIEFIPDKG